MNSLFKILENITTGAVAALSLIITGTDLSITQNGLLAFVFQDKDGNAIIPQLNAEGAIPVTSDPGTTLVSPAGKKTKAEMESAGQGTRVEIAKLTLADDKTYTKLSALISATRHTLFEIVKVEDVGGADTEEILEQVELEAGTVAFKMGLDVDIFTTAVAANTKELRLYASHLDNKSGNVYGKVSCNEIA